MSNYGFKLRYVMSKPGFLLIELMVAIFIGLVLISALMRMQSILLELQDSFFMRDKALMIAVQCLEYKTGQSGQGLFEQDLLAGADQSGRNFELDFEQADKNKFGSSVANTSVANTNAVKVKVKWRSLVGKNCCLEL
jgi:hypothetical protein